MIEKIEMSIPMYDFVIDNNVCVINNRNISIRADDIGNIIRIIRNWKSSYCNNGIIGEDEYFIRFIYNSDEYVYKFNSVYPDNFSELVSYIGDMYDRVNE